MTYSQRSSVGYVEGYNRWLIQDDSSTSDVHECVSRSQIHRYIPAAETSDSASLSYSRHGNSGVGTSTNSRLVLTLWIAGRPVIVSQSNTREKEVDFAFSRFVRVGSMNEVFGHHEAEVSSNGARRGSGGVRGAH